MKLREPTILERAEDAYYEQLGTAETDREALDALAGLGLTHLVMEPGKLRLAMQELWASMHGRSGLEVLAIAATAASYLHGAPSDPRTLEYAAAIEGDRVNGTTPRRSVGQ